MSEITQPVMSATLFLIGVTESLWSVKKIGLNDRSGCHGQGLEPIWVPSYDLEQIEKIHVDGEQRRAIAGPVG